MDLFRLDPAEVKRARVEEAVGQEEDVFIASLLENEPMLMMMDSGEGESNV